MKTVKREERLESGVSRRNFGLRVLAMGLLAPLAGLDSLVWSGTVPANGLALPAAGADFWSRPHAYVGCLQNDGSVTFSDDPELVRPGTVGAGGVLQDGSVPLGLGFVEVACADCTYLLRVVDQRSRQDQAALPVVNGPQGGLRIARSRTEAGTLEVSIAETASDTGYLLESSESLENPRWRPVAERPGTGGSLQFRLPIGDQPRGFYRLRVEPRLNF